MQTGGTKTAKASPPATTSVQPKPYPQLKPAAGCDAGRGHGVGDGDGASSDGANLVCHDEDQEVGDQLCERRGVDPGLGRCLGG